ncbi:MAG: ribosomal protein S18-alanine N-acetyltransferase [Candidatus Krumholzibacteriia bacterium]
MSLAGDMTVRPGHLSDLAQVERIERTSFSDAWSRGALASELTSDRLRLSLVAELGGEVAGYLMAWRVPDQLHILNIAVRNDRRRSGVGTALLVAAAQEAAADGLFEVTLEVRRSNTGAQAFYARHGFAPTGVRPRYYPDSGEDALILTCPVPELLRLAGGRKGTGAGELPG